MNRTGLFVLTALLFASSASAQPPERPAGLEVLAAQLLPAPAVADMLIAGATMLESEAQFADAARLYRRASVLEPTLASFLEYRALAAAFRADMPPAELEEALESEAATAPFPGAAALRVRIDARLRGQWPEPDLLAQALATDDRALICEWLTQRLEATSTDKPASGELASVVDLHHGWCSDVEVPSFADAFGVTPSPAMRVQRGERLYGMVRFYAARDELSQVNFEGIDPVLACRGEFILARTLYRIRKQRNEAEPRYRKVATRCMDPATEGERRSSLYAWGKRRYDLGDPAGAEAPFRTLYEDYPEASHADDALFYLARIARARNDRKTELALLEKALARHSDGDMVHEMVWEVHEASYRAGRYKEFLEAIESLKLPPRDNQYFSQGRLEYFVGMAYARLKKNTKAYSAWQTAWTRYPFSFYGYLSHLRLRERGQTPAPMEPVADATPSWMSREWSYAGLGRLTRLGLHRLAAEVAAAQRPKDDVDQWRRALAYHLAGRYDVSHNIVRRRIDGRPWSDSPENRAMQWELAWPNPFADVIEAAIAAESRQHAETLDPALPVSIMREESSFIEDIESYAGALGLMQLMPRTALGHDDDIEGDATPDRLKKADVNIRVGVDHLFWLARRLGEHPALMVAAYNAGAGAVSKWLRRQPNDDIALFVEDIPYLQTRDYTKRVIGSYAAYQWLRGERTLDDRVLRPAK